MDKAQLPTYRYKVTGKTCTSINRGEKKNSCNLDADATKFWPILRYLYAVSIGQGSLDPSENCLRPGKF